MENIFSSINTRLFFPLSSRDRESNYELLIKIYDIFSEDQTRTIISKEELVSEISEFIKERKFSNLEIDSEELLETQDPREKAFLKINQFRKCGWLNEDITDGFETSISLEGEVIPILEAFKKVAENKSQIEYTGYVYVIYNILKQFDKSKSTALLEQIYKNTRELMGNLQGLTTRIKRFINELIQNTDNTPQQILETLLVKYQNQVLYTVFNNLRTKDNPNRYSSEILKAMNSFLEPDNMKMLVSNYVETKNIADRTPESVAEVQKEITSKILYVIDRFEYISELINIIDSRNTKYLKSANARLKFLLNNTTDVEGLLVSAMKSIKNLSNDDFDFSSVAQAFSVSNPDSKSLYERKFSKTEKVFVKLETPRIDENAYEILKSKLFTENSYSKEKVAGFVLKMLGSLPVIKASEISICDFSSLVMLIFIQIYSQDKDMPYTTHILNENFSVLGFSMSDFEIERKEIQNDEL